MNMKFTGLLQWISMRALVLLVIPQVERGDLNSDHKKLIMIVAIIRLIEEILTKMTQVKF